MIYSLHKLLSPTEYELKNVPPEKMTPSEASVLRIALINIMESMKKEKR